MKALSEQVIMITGATDGLGKATAKELAKAGVALILHGRNPSKGEAVVDQLIQETGNSKIVYYNADFSGLQEVRILADKILSAHQQLDVLINNAGIGPGSSDEREISRDGYELRFAVNYLATFLLTDLLIPILKATVGSRVVMIASGAQQAIDFDDLMLENHYTGSRAYAQSKLAMVMFSTSLAEKLREERMVVNSVHPASLMDTALVKNSGRKPLSSVMEGVDSVLYVATSKQTAHLSGVFFDHKKQVRAEKQAYDPAARELLFTNSLRLAGL